MTHSNDGDTGAAASTISTAPPAAADRARTVASELDSLFAGIGDLPPPSVEADEDLTLSFAAPPPAPRRSMTATLGAVATVLLVGAAVGVLANRQQWLQPEAAASARAMSVAALPDPPRPAAPLAAPAAAPANTPIATDAPATAAVAAPVVAVAPTPPAPAPRRTASLETPRAAEPRRADSVDRCAALAPLAQTLCRNPALGQADGRLRQAYDQAMEAGVPWPVLARYGAEWEGLRRRAPRDPDAVAESYDAMADELHDFADRAAGPG